MSYQIVKGGLQTTQNYTWNDADILGKGATADVFLGRNKNTGHVVAVKQFRHIRPFSTFGDAELRELDMLKKLDHENVIKLHGIEQQSFSGAAVIIMEYCEGGSLHSMLDHPKNFYGLHEKLLVLVIKHVVTGIQYLQSLGIVHRDIKPGNIMRCIKHDGSDVFKLTDFGAARELDEEENFTSMYGTEEYLYPAMYETAVLRLPTGQRFDGKVDLWSLGVTFYHCATGKLPFIPFGGRNNRETMFKIISQKESGVISGIQEHENGSIRWSRELPRTCLLSGGLKRLLVPLLAGLMEQNEHKMVTHQKLFDIAKNICSRIVIKVFHYAASRELNIYVNKLESLSFLQDCIAEQTEIPAHEQILLINGHLVENEIDPTAPIETYPSQILNGVVFLFDLNSADMSDIVVLDTLPQSPRFSHPDIDGDCKIAFNCCCISHYILNITNMLISQQQLLVEGAFCLRAHLSFKIEVMLKNFATATLILEESRKRFDLFDKILQDVCRLLTRLNVPSEELHEICKIDSYLSFHKKAEERNSEVEKYKTAFLDKQDELKYKVNTLRTACELSTCGSSAKHFCDQITQLLGRFRRDKTARGEITAYDMKVHGFEREKLERVFNRNISIFSNHCCIRIKDVYKEVKDIYGSLVKANSRICKIEKNIESVIDCQQHLSVKLDELIGKYSSKLDELNTKYGHYVGVSSNVDPGYQSVHASLDSKQIIAELTQDAKEMEDLVQSSSDILARFFNEPLHSSGSLGYATSTEDNE